MYIFIVNILSSRNSANWLQGIFINKRSYSTQDYSVCNHTRNKQIGLTLRGRLILLSSLVWLQTELDSTTVLLPLKQ